MEKIGNYEILRILGKGGMGDVFLVKDPVCERTVALKQIRKELMPYKSIQDRFLREARISAGLTHPSIISVYTIHQDQDKIFYTMPYIEGNTLKQTLREIKKSEKTTTSIPSLIPIYLQVCQAIAYAHSKKVLHRDVKPENVIMGTYGEVLLLDWGLAAMVDEEDPATEIDLPEKDLTIPGKIVGTLAYMAPERILGERASILTDIYALGVVLYEILTLKLPFKRESFESFKKNGKHERVTPPLEAAPFRDIPKQLNDITLKCLAVAKEERYQNVSDIIRDLQIYIEGRPDWVLNSTLDTNEKKDWEFQENILLAKHIAITQGTEVMEWVNLMISKNPFSENIKLETSVTLGEGGNGIGFLLSVPESIARKGFEDGYSLWMGSSVNKGITLYRANVEVFNLPEHFLEIGKSSKITVEKADNHVRLFLDGQLILNYLSLLPIFGNHIGILARDAYFQMGPIAVYEGSANVMVKCLAVPDAFLANKDFSKALSEYRRISNSFLGRIEGREAIFKAGITLIEQGKIQKSNRDKEFFFQGALTEFSKLHATPSAPLEYLGKSLAYKAMNDPIEEAKCLELALRKYPTHPLTSLLTEHIVLRLHEASYHNRIEAYHLALISLRHLAHIFSKKEHLKVMESLTAHWESPSFFKKVDKEFATEDLCIKLAFWLAKPLILFEIAEEVREKPALLNNCKAALFALGFDEGVKIENDPLFTLLEERKWKEASLLFKKHSVEILQDDTTPLFFLYGCYLAGVEGIPSAIMHFSTEMEVSYPKTTQLLGHYLLGKIDFKKGWGKSAFFWERITLLKQLILFYRCAGEEKSVKHFKHQLKTELNQIKNSLSP